MTAEMDGGVRRRAVLTAALAGLAGAARAAPSDLVDLAIIDRDSGQPLWVYWYKGRAYVAGNPGRRYSLRVTNNTGGRVLAVMSVDGVNIITGQTAGYSQGGYVLDPWRSYDISGWRKSDIDVAAFTFASLSRSYAARTGRPANVGVIGVAAFRERAFIPPLPVPPVERRLEEPSPPAWTSGYGARDNEVSESVVAGQRRFPSFSQAPAPQARVEEKLGTGHGQREWSAVTKVDFERATSHPQFIRQIEYDTYANLAALGVIPRSTPPGRGPRPFPSSSGAGYVPDPPGMP